MKNQDIENPVSTSEPWSTSTAIERIIALDCGRFAPLFEACSGFGDVCFKCRCFDPKQDRQYRCFVAGSCPAASLSPQVIQYVSWKINDSKSAEYPKARSLNEF